MLRLAVILAFCLLMATSTTRAAFNLTPVPPTTARHTKDVSVHGDPRTDDFFWLREKENPAVRAYLEAENTYTEAVLAPTRALQDTLFREMRGRLKEDDTSVHIPYLGWRYYTRTEKDRQYPIYCRIAERPGATEEILLDLNQLGAGRDYVSLGHYLVSDDGARLAYSVDWTGYRQYEVFVLDLATKQPVPQKIGLVSDLTWGAGHDTLYYTTENEAKRTDRAHRWHLATGTHEELLHESDELFGLGLDVSQDGHWVFCTAESKVTSQVFAVRADDHTGHFAPLLPRIENEIAHAEHHDGFFYFITNRGAKNYRLVLAPVATPNEHWQDVLAARTEVKLEGITMFARYLVAEEREHGLPQLRRVEIATGAQHLLAMPEAAYEVEAAANWNYDTDEFRYEYQSLLRPRSVYTVNLADGTTTLLKQQEIPGGFEPTHYRAERLWATARDGMRIPISLVYRANLDRSRPQPLVLYGYGSYGISMPVTFNASRLSLLDRGVVFAIAHIRGGGELGEEWREAGRMERKQTTFRDFVDCAAWLHTQGWSTPAQTAIWGGSAGGLLLGAVLNDRPDLFHAALLDVPFVDMLNTMLDATLPLTTEEYVEWGNPNIPTEYAWMRAYSPYDNLHTAAYPHVFVNVSYYDSQVPYWEGAKYVARLRTLNTARDRAVLLRTEFGAGHGGASGRYDALHDAARDYAFFLTTLAVPQPR